MNVGRATGSTKAKLRTIRKRWPLPVHVVESGLDPTEYDVSAEEAEQGTEMILTIHGRGARQMAEQLQSTHGSSWEDDGPSLAYNAFVVWSDAERKEVIDELHKAGVAVGFEGETLPGLRERILRRRSRAPKVEFGKTRSNPKKRWTSHRWVRVGGPGDRCVRHADCRTSPELGRACCAETRKKERAQLARRKPAPKGRVYGSTDDARALAIRAGAKEPLEHLGTGATGEVFADARGLAYKVPRSSGSALTIAEEAEWLRVASQVPFVRDHVARFHHYDRGTGVLVRENVQGKRQVMTSKRSKGRLDTWELHREIERLMRPYGLGRPEYKEESYRLVRGRGWVLFDAGFSLLYGRKLIELAPKVSRDGPDGWDTASAIVQESGKTIPRPIAMRALRNLAARSTSAREYLQNNWPEYLA